MPKLHATAGLAFVAGLGVGAGLLYFLDPFSGARRRAVARQLLFAREPKLRGERIPIDQGATDEAPLDSDMTLAGLDARRLF